MTTTTKNRVDTKYRLIDCGAPHVLSQHRTLSGAGRAYLRLSWYARTLEISGKACVLDTDGNDVTDAAIDAHCEGASPCP